MIRYWGLLDKNCLPVFTKSAENIDILVTLFRLLTKLSFNPSEPDEVLVGELKIVNSILNLTFLNPKY